MEAKGEPDDHWLHTVEPDCHRDGNPAWDGSHMDIDEVLTWMRISEKTRGASARV